MRNYLIVLMVVGMVMPAMAAPVVSFVSNVTQGNVNVPIQFTDISTSTLPIKGWNWTQKNVNVASPVETRFSTKQNATQTFGYGNFSIRLNVTDGTNFNITPAFTHWVNVSGAGSINQSNYSAVNSIKILPNDNIWKAAVNTLPLDPRSDTYIAASNSTSHIFITKSFHINVVNSSIIKQNYAYIELPSLSDVDPMPIPDNVYIEAISDHHMFLIDEDTNTLYESFSTAKLANGTYKTSTTETYDLTSNELHPEHRVSADGAGLQMVPGIIRYEEILNGSIDHALRITMYTSGNTYVWPARAPGVQDNLSYPGMGQRFRLNASFDDSGYSAQNKIIVAALKKYGAMLSDNSDIGSGGNTWTLYADDDPRWGGTQTDFDTMIVTNFEAVNVTVLMLDKDSGQANLHAMAPVAISSANQIWGWICGIFAITVICLALYFHKWG